MRQVAAFFLVLGCFAGTALAQPTFTQVFGPEAIGPGSASTLLFTIDNGSGSPVEDMAFTNVLPASVTIASAPGAATTCPGGAVTAPAGGSTITFADGSVGGGQSCTVTVHVTSSTAGVHSNVPGLLTTSAGSSSASSVDLTVDTGRPGFTKGFTPSSLSLGARSTLTYTIDNTANAAGVTSLSFTDALPPGIEIADPARASTTCDAGPQAPTLDAAPGTTSVSFSVFGFAFPGFEVLAAGASCTVVVDVVAVGVGVFESISSDLSLGVDSAGKATAVLTSTVTPLAIQKAFVDDPVPPGGSVELEFVVSNFDRSASATSVAFTDDLASALTGLTFDSLLSNDCGGTVTGTGTTSLALTGASLPAQGSCVVLAKLSVPLAAVAGAYVNTTSAITGTVGGVGATGNQATDTLFVESAPRLTKAFLDDPVSPGDNVELEFTVTNTSPTSSATDIAFDDEFAVVLPTASVPPPSECCGAGSSCTFTPLSNPPPPSSTIPARLSVTGGTLAPAGSAGDSCTFSLTLDVLSGAPAGLYPNTTSTVTATVDGAIRTGSPASDDLVIVAAPSLTKTFVDDPVAPGGTVTLEFTLSQPPDASGDATDITFTDDLDAVLAGLTANLPASPDPPCGASSTLTGSAGDTLLTLAGGSLMPGEACTFSVTLDVPLAAAPGDYTNTTSGVSATVEGSTATSASASDDLSITGLVVTKQFLDDPVLPGETVTLRFTLENTSPTDDATNIFFTDDLRNVLPGTPDLSVAAPLPLTPCGAGSSLNDSSGFLIFVDGEVAQGAPPCSFDVLLLVPAGAPDGSFVNTTSSPSATIGGTTVVLNPAVDRLEIESDLLLLTKEFLAETVEPGGTIDLRFTLTNLDAARMATAIAFSDDLDAVLTGLKATGLPVAACGGTVDALPDAGTIDFSGGSLGPSGTCSFDVSVAAPPDAPDGDYVNTTSAVSGQIAGLAVTGDPAIDELRVLDALTFTKVFVGPTTSGRTVILTFTLVNPRPTTALDLGFVDDLDAVLPGLVATNLPLADVCGSGSLAFGTSTVSLSGGELPPNGGTCSFDVELSVPPSAPPGTYLNTTTPLSESGLEVAVPATASLVVEPPPAFSKSFSPDTVGLGGTSVLTFTIDNSASTFAATGLDFTDNLPAGLVVASPSDAATTCTGGTVSAVPGSGVVTYSAGTVGAGAACSVTVDVVTTSVGVLVNTSGDLTSSNGNSGSAAATLTVEDQTPPEVTAITTDDGELAVCDAVRAPISTLGVTIEDAVSAIVGADSASSYLLVASGPDGDFSTVDCSGGVAGDDVEVSISGVQVGGSDPSIAEVSLTVAGGLGLDAGLYRLLVCDIIGDSAGNPLGGDEVRVPFFRADPRNAFENAHFDDCPSTLDPWTVVETAPNLVVPGALGSDDFAESPLSTSARVAHTSADPSSLGQCVAVEGDSFLELASWARFETTSALAVLNQSCEFFDGPSCAGTSIGVASFASLLESGGSDWSFSGSTLQVPTAAVSALCSFDVGPLGSDPDFDLYLDGLFLGDANPEAIFTDGFESGDTSAWSSNVP